ncbi:MAG TPA: S53 family peptidase [Mycobacteriales bacterium]|nr:S53 family peptidase [Mycobacteriales bacterium]
MRAPRALTLLATAAVLLGGGTAGAFAATSTTTTTANISVSGLLQPLTWDVLPGLAKLTPTGHPAGNRILHLAVMLQNPHDAALQKLAYAVNDPKSPQYRHFRTPAQLDAAYGLPASTGAELRRWLTGGGLRIGYAAPSNDFVEAEGTVSQVEKLLATKLATFADKGLHFIANTSAPRVPANLDVASLMGLNSLQHFSPGTATATKHNRPAATGCLLGLKFPCEEGYDAADISRLYDGPASNQGQGQSMAIFGEGQTAPVIGDLRRFEAYNHLPRVNVKVIHTGLGPYVSNDGQDEWDLDTQASTAMAPDVSQLDLYFARSLSDADVATEFAQWINDPDAPLQASASFGECETDPLNVAFGNPVLTNLHLPVAEGLGDNLEPAIENTLMPRILAEGRTLFNSSGDTGSSCPVLVVSGVGGGNGLLNQVAPIQSYPTVSKYVVSVGGTLLYSDGKTPPNRKLEIASPYGGGGSSLFNSAPPWQSKVLTLPCVVGYDGQLYPLGTKCRGVPDVSAQFGDPVALGFDVFVDGRLLTTGGTSLASPLWMGAWTRVQAAARNPRSGNGSADPILYRIGQSSAYHQAFHDVSVGTNGLYVASPGYDLVTGWGSPDMTGLIKAVDGKLAPTDLAEVAPAPLQPLAHCSTVFISPANNAIDATLIGYPGNLSPQPQLDIVKGALSLARGGKYLRTVMTIADLSTKLPLDAVQPTTALPGGEDWTFDVVAHGTTYFATAHYETGSAVTYSGGKISHKTGTAVPLKGDPILGSFKPGHDGTITMDIPLSAMGNPKLGSRIQEPMAYTAIDSALPFLAFADAAGPNLDYSLGAEQDHKC